MDKEISRHDALMAEEIAKLGDRPSPQKVRDLLLYHDIMTRNFQHERLIHLIVTLFFAGLMLSSWALAGFTTITADDLHSLIWPADLLALILTILEAAYIRHYFRLENRTQKLYRHTKKLREILAAAE
ncbi:MAG: hypothetical protein LBM73_01480 [Candidatus Nomurabacteria bacterium]|jgi:hypothetical protein|nr:hypothetical protein [Candidatus Nomurabacteria bacterium]